MAGGIFPYQGFSVKSIFKIKTFARITVRHKQKTTHKADESFFIGIHGSIGTSAKNEKSSLNVLLKFDLPLRHCFGQFCAFRQTISQNRP